MWRQASHPRIVFSLALGVLAGVALLSIPSFFIPTQIASYNDTARDTEGLIAGPSFTDSSGQEPTKDPPATPSTAPVLPYLNLFFVLFPASILGFLARRWTRGKLGKSQQ